MKRRNRLTAVLTAGVMSVLCAVPVPAQADEEVVIDGITYAYYTEYDYAYVKKCDPSVTNAVIQSTVNGMPVTNIGGGAFSGCTSLTAITIPEGCRFTSREFSGCTALQTVISSGDHPYYFKDHAIYRDNCLYVYIGSANETEYTVPADTAYLGTTAFSCRYAISELTILNPDCYIPEGDPDSYYNCAIPCGITIHGYDDSTAYRYAMVYGNKFVSLGKSAAAPTGSTGYAPADLDGNGVINAADAASILLYAAYVGAGGTDDIMTFLAGR